MLLATATAVALVLAGLVFALVVDAGSAATLPAGTAVGEVPVGGLEAGAATSRVRSRLEPALRRPIKVRAGSFETDTSAWDLGYRIDAGAVVRRALRETRGSNLVARSWQRLFPPGPRFFEVRPAWGEGDLEALLTRAGNAIRTAPQDADLDVSTGWLRIVPEKAGLALDVEESRRVLREAAVLGDEAARLPTTAVPPTGDDPTAKVILVRSGENRLYLYEAGRIIRSWDVATGLPDYPTPQGIFRVVSKLVNPTWVNPGSRWARDLPARIGPGPSNPLGTRALQLDAPGILIHATSQSRSIGFNASHGCIRMTEADERELFGLVGTGTRVAVVGAGPPRIRGQEPPPTATPEQTAAAVF